MASRRENKIALAKARRERGIISSQNRILDTIKKEEERMAFNQAMGSNVATAKPLTSAQEGRFYEATGLDNASNPQEAIKGEVLNTGLSFVQVANALANKAGGRDIVAKGAGQVLGRMGPYGTGTTDTGKAIDTYTKWGTGNVTKGDVANVSLTGTGIKAGVSAVKAIPKIAKPIIPVATSKAGKLAAASIASVAGVGLADTDTAQAASPVVIAKPGLRLLSEIFSGQAGGARNIVPQTLQGAKEVLRTGFDSVAERAAEVGKGLETTLTDKENKASASLAAHTIGDRTLSDIMVEAGLPDRFRTAVDTALDTAKKGVTVADTARNTDILEQLTPAGAMVRDVKAPDSVGGFYLPHGAHMFENDHGVAVSGVTQIIKEQAETIIKGGGQLDQAWYDESQKLLDLVNSVDNIQRVPRVWNQLKKNYPPDVAKKLLKKQFPGLERHMGSTDYFDYLFDQWTNVARTKPFGLDEKSIKEAYGRAPAWFERLNK